MAQRLEAPSRFHHCLVTISFLPGSGTGRLGNEQQAGFRESASGCSSLDFEDWGKRQPVFEQLAAKKNTIFNLTGDGEPERVAAVAVTADLFPVLSISPFIGRGFLPEEEQVGHNHVTLLSYGLWQR